MDKFDLEHITKLLNRCFDLHLDTEQFKGKYLVKKNGELVVEDESNTK